MLQGGAAELPRPTGAGFGLSSSCSGRLTQLAEVGLSILLGTGSEEAWDDARDDCCFTEDYGVLPPLAALRQLTSLRLHNTRLPPDLHQLSGLRALRINSVALEPWCDEAVGAISWTLDPWTALSRLTLLELKSALPGGGGAPCRLPQGRAACPVPAWLSQAGLLVAAAGAAADVEVVATLPNLAKIRVADTAGNEENGTWRSAFKRLQPSVRHTPWKQVPQY